MLRVVFAMMAGIGLEIGIDYWLHPAHTATMLMALLLFCSIGFMLILSRLKNVTLAYRLRLLNGVAITTAIISFAYLLTWFYSDKNYASEFSHLLEGQNILVVKIHEPPVLHDKVVIVNAEVKEVNNAQGNFKTQGNIQLDFLRDTVCERLNYGDVLLIKSKVDTVKGPANPYERNYKTLLSFHNIYNKAFVTRGDWALVKPNQGNPLLFAIYQLRNSFLKVIARYVTDKNDFGVATAITLGYRDYLSFEIYQAYSNSGTVQVLSVSALHVLIMFFTINFLLQWMDKRGRKMLFVKTGLIISFIWFYACITGLTLPVMRCATMFTLVQLGTVLTRNVNRYNIVAASALLLMLINPFVITEIGFQLSYLAVFVLYYLQPKIAGLFIIKTPDRPHYQKQTNGLLIPITFLLYYLQWLAIKLLDFTWQLIAACLAAQIAIMPLCLFYFYQFPNLFLFSNIIVVPLSNLLIFTGTVLFAVNHIPFINDIVGYTFSHILWLLNRFVFWIDSIPFSITKGITVSASEMILLYMLIVLLCWLTEERKKKIVISALTVILILSTLSSFKKFEQAGQKELVVYSVSKQKAIAFISGKNLYYDIDPALYNNQSNMLFNILHHWWQAGISQQIPVNDSLSNTHAEIYSTTLTTGRLILFEGKKILLVDSLATASYYGAKIKLRPDLVILSGNIKISIPILKKSVDFDEIVFDSSCKPSARKRWKKDCSNLNINYYDVNTDGAFVWNLKQEMP
jgi:competence protein ComEC